MSVEAHGHAHRPGADPHLHLRAATPGVSPGPKCRPAVGGWLMSAATQLQPLPELQPTLLQITSRFQAHIESIRVARPNEVYLQVRPDALAALCAFLYRKVKGRLVSLFAED